MAKKQKVRYFLVFIVFVMLLSEVQETKGKDDAWLKRWRKENPVWRGLHLSVNSGEKLGVLKDLIREYLEPMGFNILIAEVGYSYRFEKFEGMGSEGLNGEQARELSKFCRARGIRIIPLFNCLGHQPKKKNRASLLRMYPQFDETPRKPWGTKKLYSREWCPMHPDLYPVVFELLDELISAFDADAFHVGMDEVFLIGDKDCPRCKNTPVGLLYSWAVNQLYYHIVKEKGLEMLMWGDRFLDSNEMKDYSSWESSKTGSHTAVDFVPRDIIICDWHYRMNSPEFPSVRFFREKGFTRILPSTWHYPEAALKFWEVSQRDAPEQVSGILFTGWGTGRNGELLLKVMRDYENREKHPKMPRGIAEAIKQCVKEMDNSIKSK